MAILSRAAFGLLLVATGAEAFTGVGVAPLRTHTAGSVCAAPKGLKLAPSRATANLRVAAAAKMTAAKMAISTEEKGSFPSEEYRMFFKDGSTTVSPWHGIDTWADKDKGIVNAVIEISKNTRPKMEVATKEESNPIKQDMKKGKLRDYPLDIFWNYGMIPKTWENPKHEHPELKAFGDDDPVDIVEIGSASIARGSVVQVKALGTLAMIDEGELDWKVIGVSTADPKADSINSLDDLDKAFPGQIDEIREWFRNYKSDGTYKDGKWSGITEGQNSFGFDDKCLDAAKTKEVIVETEGEYAALMAGKVDADGLSLK
jgi:inorganic pyrophosphatase